VTVRGIDVSGWNGAIDWGAVVGAGFEFAYIKAGEGTTGKSKAWRNHVIDGGAHESGLYVGPYYFPRTDFDRTAGAGLKTAERQARNFRKLVGDVWQPEGWLPPAVDFEWHKRDKFTGSRDRVAWALDVLAAVEDLFGVTPLVYIPKSYFRYQLRSDARFGRYPLWVPAPDKASGLPPKIDDHMKAWDHWTIWQDSHKARVPGVESKRTDTNVWHGSLDDLRAFCGDAGHTSNTKDSSK
jgi:GH25 family lysozyme M1 (1,4-beta-N-acetylmuramidase)